MPATRGYEPKFYEGDFSLETAAFNEPIDKSSKWIETRYGWLD